jgi:hypothetical protein
MSSNNYFIMLVFSIIGSFITAFAFAASSSGRFSLSTLMLPGVVQTASIAAIVFGIVFSPFMFWCLKGKNLLLVLPIAYVLAFIITVLLSFIDQRLGLAGAFIYWALFLLSMKYYGPIVSM